MVIEKSCICCEACYDICTTNCITKKYGIFEIEQAKCIECGICHEVCPIDCISQSKKRFKIDQNACIKCGICFEICSDECIMKKDDIYYINIDDCTECGICHNVCPSKAIIDKKQNLKNTDNFKLNNNGCKCIQDRDKQAVKCAMISAAGFGPLGALSTVGDITGIVVAWGELLCFMGVERGIKINDNVAKNICKAVIKGGLKYYAGCKFATRLFNMIPEAGIFVAMGVSTFANVLYTYKFARTISNLFDEGVDFSNCNKVNIVHIICDKFQDVEDIFTEINNIVLIFKNY